VNKLRWLLIAAHSGEARAYDQYSRFYPSNLYDDIVDSEAARVYYEESSSRPKHLHWMEEAGHMIPIDTGWEELAEEIAEFAAPAEGVTE
jgi:hypothetical protein